MNVDELPDTVFRTTGRSGSQDRIVVHATRDCSRLCQPHVTNIRPLDLGTVLADDDGDHFKWCSECVVGDAFSRSAAQTALLDADPEDIPP